MGDTYAHGQGRRQPSTSVPAVLALVVAVATLAVAGCSAIDPTTTAATTPSTADAAPTTVPVDIQQVCTRFVATALSVDTATDRGPADARVRAARAYGVPDLPDRLQGHGKDPEWPLLVTHRARVQVSTQPVADDPPPARGDTAAAGVHATRVAVGAHNWRQQMSDTVTYCSLRRGPAGWKVTDVTVSDTSGTSGAER